MLAIMPFACAAILFLVLRLWADDDVKYATEYLFMYTLMGAAWLGVFLKIATFCGIDPIVDTLEHRNPAVLIPSAALMVALTVAFAGGNMGNGPGWWVVIFSSGIACGSLLLCWLVLECLRDDSPSEKITVDRDITAGVRFAGLLLSCGLIFGRAAAGDWVSADATFIDFICLAWPGFLLTGVFLVQELVLPRPPSDNGAEVVTTGILPAGAYLAAALGWLYYVGPWQ